MKNRVSLKLLLLLTIIFTTPCCGIAQLDTSFWFAVPEISQSFGNFDRPIVLRVSTLGEAADITVSIPANPSFNPITINVPANNTGTIDLTPWIDLVEAKPYDAILNTGLKISASRPVNIYYEVISGEGTNCQCNPEIFVLKGKNAIGRNFIIPSQNKLNNGDVYAPVPFHSFDIIAIEDNTIVTVVPNKNVSGHRAGTPFSFNLDKGQVYSASSTTQSAHGHLGGSTVQADKPIAITVKDDLLGSEFCWDLGGDQIIPIQHLSTEYIAIRGFLDVGNKDMVFVTAVSNNTKVYKDGVLKEIIHAGETSSIPFDSDAMRITASNKVYAFQLSGFGCETGLSSIPSNYCRGSSSVSFTRSSAQDLFLLITTKTRNKNSFFLNGKPLSGHLFNAVPGTGNQWMYARIPVPLDQVAALSAGVLSNTNGIFQMGIIHGAESGGARFAYFSDFGNPALSVLPDTLKTCGENKLLDAGSGFDDYIWNTGASSQTITATQNGLYKVTVTNEDGCQLSDSSYIKLETVKTNSSLANICSGQTYMLPWGVTVNTPGLYRDTLRYPSGCDSVRISVNLNVQSAPGSNRNVNICAGQNYTLPSGAIVNTSGIYRDTLRYASGCDSLVRVVLLNVRNVNHVTVQESICIGQAYRLPSGTIVRNAGIYDDTLRSLSAGCDSLITRVSLQTYSKPEVVLSKSNDIDCSSANTRLNASGGKTYLWSPANSLNDPGAPNPIASPLATTMYHVQAMSAQGCTSEDSIEVKVLFDPSNKLPVANAFTPDNNGRNDCFGVQSWGTVSDLRLLVYNRWGNLIFQSTDPTACWDGIYKGIKQPPGAYIYQVSAKTTCGPIYQKGTVMLIR